MYLGKGKKNYFLVFFLILSLSASGQTGKSYKYHFNGGSQENDIKTGNQAVVINYSLSELDIENITNSNGTFYRLSIPGHSFTSEPGKPELPVFCRLIEIPDGCPVSVNISDVKSTEIKPSDKSFSGLLFPAQESSVKQLDTKKADFVIDKKIYGNRGLIKSDTVTIQHLGRLRGRQLATIAISPVRYNPESNILEVITSMKITVSFTGNPLAATKSSLSESALFNETLDKGILNYYPSDFITGFSDQPVEMIIVTDTAFAKFLQPLFVWKKQKGFKLDVLYRGDGLAGSTYSEIKESIARVYNAALMKGHPPEYLLIIGDAQRIPYYGSGFVTDMYYGEFDGNGDYIPDMFIGRIPAPDTSAVKSAVQKIIQYEKFEFADSNKFYSRALAIAGKDANYADYMNGQVKYAITNYLNTTNRINEYHFYYPDGYTRKDSVMKLISGGLSFINYTGHGTSDAWLHLDISSSDVNSFNNNNMYPFVISNACRTAQFTDTASLGNKMVNSSHKGAIGFIGCTNDSYWDEDFMWAVGAGTPNSNPKYSDTGLGAYDRLFHTHGESPSDWYISMGQVNYAGNLAVSASTSARKKYYWETYTLLGDPSLIPYIGTPSAFTASLPDTLPNGITSLSLTIDPFAYIAVSHSDTLWDASFAGPSGSVVLKLPGISNDSCLFVMTGQNHKPIIRTVHFSDLTKEYINLSGQSLSDPGGNNNGKADFGETLFLNLKLSNLGLADATDLTANISSTSPWVTINNSFASLGTLPARSETNLENVLKMTIGNNVPDLGVITIDLTLSDSKVVKKYKIDITIHAPELEIINCLIDDSVLGNNNMMADPGETFTLVFQVRNIGSSSTSGQFSVQSQQTDLTVVDQNIKSGTLQFGQVTNIPVTVKLSEDAPFGDFISIASKLDCNPFIVDRDFTIRVGKIRESFESSTFKVFPWINASPVPWIISGTNSVDGLLSAHSGDISHNGITSLAIRTFYPEPDTLKFYYKVSCEPNYDYMAFNLNGNELLRRSGESLWEKATIPVPAGLNKMEWVYRKDNSVSQGADGAWIDLIDFSVATPVNFIKRDLEVSEIVNPVQKESYGQEPVEVKVLNLGADTLRGFNLAYSINGRYPEIQYFGDQVLLSQDSVTVTFERPANLDLNGIYNIMVYGYDNNDDYPANDTLKLSLLNSEIKESINVYPNPFTDKVKISLNSKTSFKARITLTSTSGKRVINLDRDIAEGENYIELDTRSLSPSLYILSVNGSVFTRSVPIIKVRQ